MISTALKQIRLRFCRRVIKPGYIAIFWTGFMLNALALPPVQRANAQAKSIPWDMDSLAKPPKFYESGVTTGGVRGLYFDGLAWKGKTTRVFAWYGVPKTRPGEKVPAVVLLHGGGGTAFDEWVRIWNQHGYAAIALGLEGQRPGGHRPYPRDEFSGPQRSGTFGDIDQPPEEQWFYHAVADAVLANSLLRSFPEVDTVRIGVEGVSWGGVLTTALIGVDRRFAFAVSIYGCGFLNETPLFSANLAKDAHTQGYLQFWEPANFLAKASLPILWVNDANDVYFPLNAFAKTAMVPKGPSVVSVHIGMKHNQKAANAQLEVYAFADSVTKKGEPLIEIEAQGREGRQIWVQFHTIRPLMHAELVYTTEPKDWVHAVWQTQPVQVGVQKNRATVELPAGVRGYFFNLVDDRSLQVSTPLCEVDLDAAADANRSFLNARQHG